MGELLFLKRDQGVEDIPDQAVDVELAAVTSIEAARVRRELCRLPELERIVICWRYGIGCMPVGHREIARRLNVSLGTAWNIEQRALERLRDAYRTRSAA